MLVGQGPDEEAIESMLRQLEVGIPADALDLLSLPVSLSRGEYLALYTANVKTVDSLWALSRNEIERILGLSRAEEFVKLQATANA